MIQIGKTALVLIVCSLISCTYGPEKDHSKFGNLYFDSATNQILFIFEIDKYKSASGINAFPDGGMSKTIASGYTLGLYDIDNSQVEVLEKDIDESKCGGSPCYRYAINPLADLGPSKYLIRRERMNTHGERLDQKIFIIDLSDRSRKTFPDLWAENFEDYKSEKRGDLLYFLVDNSMRMFVEVCKSRMPKRSDCALRYRNENGNYKEVDSLPHESVIGVKEHEILYSKGLGKETSYYSYDALTNQIRANIQRGRDPTDIAIENKIRQQIEISIEQRNKSVIVSQGKALELWLDKGKAKKVLPLDLSRLY